MHINQISSKTNKKLQAHLLMHQSSFKLTELKHVGAKTPNIYKHTVIEEKKGKKMVSNGFQIIEEMGIYPQSSTT